MRQIYCTFLFFVFSVVLFAQNDTIKQSEMEIVSSYEKMPEFIGGFEALRRYIATNAIYTEKARNDSVSGKVFVNFWVEKDGSISEVRVLKGLHPDLDSISLAMIESMPKWIPGTNRGRPTKSQYNLPIRFEISNIQNPDNPEPSKYWSRRGKRKFMRICLNDFRKSNEECACWHEFIILNYNNRKVEELDFVEMFKKHQCNQNLQKSSIN